MRIAVKCKQGSWKGQPNTIKAVVQRILTKGCKGLQVQNMQDTQLLQTQIMRSDLTQMFSANDVAHFDPGSWLQHAHEGQPQSIH